MKGLFYWNKLWSLKSLAMLKCEIRFNLHAVQYKLQPRSVLMHCSYYLKNGWPRHLCSYVLALNILTDLFHQVPYNNREVLCLRSCMSSKTSLLQVFQKTFRLSSGFAFNLAYSHKNSFFPQFVICAANMFAKKLS